MPWSPVPDPARPRGPLLAGAAVSLLVVVVLSAMVALDTPGLDLFDSSLGLSPEEWTFGHPWARSVIEPDWSWYDRPPGTDPTVR
jgi:hypothetical protein